MILKGDLLANLLEDNATDPFRIVPVSAPAIQRIRESGAAAVDLRLGTWFVTLRQSKLSVLDVSQSSGNQIGEHQLIKRHYIPFGDKYIIHPGNFVLGVTLEWIRLPGALAGYVVGKSSWGRRGLIIATAAGVHPGFAGCLTLELSNVGEIPIAIKPGMPICQLFVHRVDTTSVDHTDQSRFVGFRRPTLGKINLDETAKLLSRL